ncbi:uncharacterized protein N7443_000815 [Penicillium atrosanguineum]|uniref:Large ribosomal subunit protein mL50 n=1 Tax=Penicillium atrosanguineum TaxID=1132637 RepID=A0A9W9UC57_9EURO|nr:uncharacterized protein N7443_000815 [Penicillium atrosanguineum]KAJ5147595.1 hypothetical protein N7526_000947 [Penicillium atrosanguineum]KAJ5313931.1 hypothetical protein N7443_000815 [Penicillium atrosanguineum]KAJ5331101.1 hypothetical protein N7476_000884 [Penicillium atrosanguineum]
MRPSMRLPFREALYVCSNCRSEAPRRISPLARQIRHYASDSPSVLERTRSSLWKGNKAPGPADPYTGESQLVPGAEKGEGDLAAPAEGEELQDGSAYVQAQTWDGLKRIGHTKEQVWKFNGRSPVDEYERFGADVTPKPIPAAAHQAAVEISLMAMLGKDLASVSEIGEHYEQIQELIDGCAVGSSETQQWNTGLRFPDQQTMEALIFVFNQVGVQTEKTIESPETFISQEKTSAEAPRDLSLADPVVKFAFIKRFSQLTGRRIPDAAITSSTTVGEIIASLSTALKEKPINVSKKLARQASVGALPPNIQFSKKRLSKGDEDESLGRKKAIYTELIRRGLIVRKQRGNKNRTIEKATGLEPEY